MIIVENAYLSFNKLLNKFSESKLKHSGLSKNCLVDSSVKLGENVSIGHFSVVGENCKIGNNVMIGGQAGISGHLKIGSNVQIAGGSGVIKNVPDNSKIMGYPAKNIKNFLRDNK